MREFASAKTNAVEKYGEDLEKNEGEKTGEAEIRTRKTFWHWLSTFVYILTYSVPLRENIRQLWGFNRGTLIFLLPQYPIARTHLRHREMVGRGLLKKQRKKAEDSLFML